MDATVNGLHHITAISGDAQRNLDFYAGLLGLRFVKKTVNFDDPSVYHLYYGDELGRPGTALTFFVWAHLPPGRAGVGEASLTQFAIPNGALAFWRERLQTGGARITGEDERFGERRLILHDPDGMTLALVELEEADPRPPWTTDAVGAEAAIRGFHGVSLTIADPEPTAELLTGPLGYEMLREDGAVRRYRAPEAPHARFVDVVTDTNGPRARQGAGSIHHVAFAVGNRAAQLAVRERLVAAGQAVTPQIDRTYFFLIYFRAPGGVLFEVATEEPGFTVDEPAGELGRNLKLPPQHEHLRTQLERTLPPLEV